MKWIVIIMTSLILVGVGVVGVNQESYTMIRVYADNGGTDSSHYRY